MRVFSRAYINECLSKYDWILEHEIVTKDFNVVEINVKMEEEVYIMKLLSEDFDISKVFYEDFIGVSAPISCDIHINVMLTSKIDSIEIDVRL